MMWNMKKLFRGGFGDYTMYTVAENMGDALENIRNRLNMHALPVVAEQIEIVDGHVIVAIKESELHELDAVEEVDEVLPAELKTAELSEVEEPVDMEKKVEEESVESEKVSELEPKLAKRK